MEALKEFVASVVPDAANFLIAALFAALIWPMIPLNVTTKIIILFVGGIWLVLAIFEFSFELTEAFPRVTPFLAIPLTALAFLFLPVFCMVQHNIYFDTYMESIPHDNQLSFRITYNIEHVQSSGNVGSDWIYNHYLNDQEFKNGDILTVPANKKMYIRSEFIESDLIPDVGETTNFAFQVTSKNCSQTHIITNKVRVYEIGGRRNAGAYVDYLVTYSAKRVPPPSLYFWGVFFSTPGKSGVLFLCCLMLAFIAEIALIKRAFFWGREMKAEREALEHQKRLDDFLAILNGRSIRDAAGVPSNITFEEGLPKKDDSPEKYGSYTVFISSSGRCYHEKKGCSSAYTPLHRFNAVGRYRPCSKCCLGSDPVPQWHITYQSLMKQANELGFE